MSTAEEFAQHLQTIVSGTVYTSKLPAKSDSADDQWSVVADGGVEATGGNFLLWKQQLNLRVSYRHRKSARSMTRTAICWTLWPPSRQRRAPLCCLEPSSQCQTPMKTLKAVTRPPGRSN